MVGSIYVISRELVRRWDAATLMRCASQWEFACSVRGCCDHHSCARLTQREFDACDRQLNAACGEPAVAGSTARFRNCTQHLARSTAGRTDCGFETARPEHGAPMFYYPDRWTSDHGDDHLLSFCAMTAGKGRLIYQPCFTHHSPYMLHKNGKGWRDSELRLARHNNVIPRPQKTGEPPGPNCTAGKYLAFHYVRPEQQQPLYERGGSPG